MQKTNFKTLTHLNKKVTVLGYPPFVFMALILILFVLNVIGFVSINNMFSKVFSVGINIVFGVFSYYNMQRIKKRQLPLYMTMSNPKKSLLIKDNNQILNILYNNDGN